MMIKINNKYYKPKLDVPNFKFDISIHISDYKFYTDWICINDINSLENLIIEREEYSDYLDYKLYNCKPNNIDMKSNNDHHLVTFTFGRVTLFDNIIRKRDNKFKNLLDNV